MRNLLTLALILLCSNQIFGHASHRYIDDTLEHEFVHHNVVPHEEFARRNLAEATWTPIRILANYDNLFFSGLNDTEIDFLKNKLIPDVISFFKKALSVVRYSPTGKLTFPSDRCNEALILPKYQNSSIDADFVIFVSATYLPDAKFAVGSSCFYGNDNRPIGGTITFNSGFRTPHSPQYVSMYNAIRHELTHVLGFDANIFQFWKTGPKNLQAVNWRGTNGTIINTTRVAEVARRHFGCSNLTGLELENQGGAGVKGTHWERRVVGNEIMTATSMSDTRYSSFTLALLEDSGWYKANYTMADPLDFGRNKGCSFIFQTCIDPVAKKARFPEFCTKSSGICPVNGDTTGLCTIKISNATVFNYLGNNTTSSDDFSDECPLFLASDYPCSDNIHTAPLPYLPEVYGATSKCLSGTLFDYRWGRGISSSIQDGCYNTTSSIVNNVSKISITIGNTTYNCPSTGAQITNIPGYSGYLTCPDADLYSTPTTKSTEIINPNIPL